MSTQPIHDPIRRTKIVAALGDQVILTRGDEMNAHGGTNTMKILGV